MRRRLIFLDIDGVICCNSSGQLEPAKLAELQRIVRLTGAKIVLSTALDSWFQMASKGEPIGPPQRPESPERTRLPGRRVTWPICPDVSAAPAPSKMRVSHSQPIGLAAPARAEGEAAQCTPTNRRRLCRRDAAACNVPAGTPALC